MWSGLLIVLVLLVSTSHQSPVQRHLSDVDNPPQQLLDRLSYWDELYSNHPQNDNIKRSSYDADAFWKRGKSEGSNAAFWKRGSNDADYASFWKRAGPSDRQIEQFWKRGGLFMEEPAAFWKRGEQDAWRNPRRSSPLRDAQTRRAAAGHAEQKPLVRGDRREHAGRRDLSSGAQGGAQERREYTARVQPLGLVDLIDSRGLARSHRRCALCVSDNKIIRYNLLSVFVLYHL